MAIKQFASWRLKKIRKNHLSIWAVLSREGSDGAKVWGLDSKGANKIEIIFMLPPQTVRGPGMISLPVMAVLPLGSPEYADMYSMAIHDVYPLKSNPIWRCLLCKNSQEPLHGQFQTFYLKNDTFQRVLGKMQSNSPFSVLNLITAFEFWISIFLILPPPYLSFSK